MSSHQTDSLVPYLCEQCGIVSVNVMADKPTCPRRDGHTIHPYASSSKARLAAEMIEKRKLKGEMRLHRRLLRFVFRQTSPEMASKPDRVVNWGDSELLDQFYACPACKRETMKFHNTGRHFD